MNSAEAVMRHFFAVVAVAAVGFQWVQLASWAMDHDLAVYRAAWSEDAVTVALTPAPPTRSAEVTLASARTTP